MVCSSGECVCASGYTKSGDKCVANGYGPNGGGETPVSTKTINIYYASGDGGKLVNSNSKYELKFYSEARNYWVADSTKTGDDAWYYDVCKSTDTSCKVHTYNSGTDWQLAKDGYVAQAGAEWAALQEDGTYVSIDQSKTYTYNELMRIRTKCGDYSCSLWLYPNWVEPVTEETKECYVCVKEGTQYVMATTAENAAKGATKLTGVTADNCSVTDKSNCSGNTTDKCYECQAKGATTQHVMAKSLDEAKNKSGYVNCSEVATDKCNSGGNPQTGTVGIIIAWVVALFTVGYAIWYFKKSSSLD